MIKFSQHIITSHYHKHRLQALSRSSSKFAVSDLIFVKIWIGLIIFFTFLPNIIFCFMYEAIETTINGKTYYKLTFGNQPWVNAFYGEFFINFVHVITLYIPYVIFTICVFISIGSVSCWYSKYKQVTKHKLNQQSPSRSAALNYVDWNRNISDMKLTKATFVIIMWFFLVQTVQFIFHLVSKGTIKLPTRYAERIAIYYTKQLFVNLIYVCKPIVYLCLNSKFRSMFLNPCGEGDEEDQLVTGPIGQGVASILAQGQLNVPRGSPGSAPVTPTHRVYESNVKEPPGSAPGSPRLKGYVSRHAYLYNMRKTQSAPTSPVVSRAKSFVA